MARRVSASGRGGALLAALGVSLSLAACETPQKPEAPVATSPEVSQDQGASQAPTVAVDMPVDRQDVSDLSDKTFRAADASTLKNELNSIPAEIAPPVQMYGAVPVDIPRSVEVPAPTGVSE